MNALRAAPKATPAPARSLASRAHEEGRAEPGSEPSDSATRAVPAGDVAAAERDPEALERSLQHAGAPAARAGLRAISLSRAGLSAAMLTRGLEPDAAVPSVATHAPRRSPRWLVPGLIACALACGACWFLLH